MQRLAFEYTIKKTILNKDWDIIKYVYNHHPIFKGKDDAENVKKIAQLYTEFGMPLIKEMAYIANQIEKLNTHIKSLNLQIKKCEEKISQLENGNFKIYIKEK